MSACKDCGFEEPERTSHDYAADLIAHGEFSGYICETFQIACRSMIRASACQDRTIDDLHNKLSQAKGVKVVPNIPIRDRVNLFRQETNANPNARFSTGTVVELVDEIEKLLKREEEQAAAVDGARELARTVEAQRDRLSMDLSTEAEALRFCREMIGYLRPSPESIMTYAHVSGTEPKVTNTHGSMLLGEVTESGDRVVRPGALRGTIVLVGQYYRFEASHLTLYDLHACGQWNNAQRPNAPIKRLVFTGWKLPKKGNP